MNTIYLANVGKTLSLNNPEKNWLHVLRIKENYETTYQVIRKENDSYIIVSTSGGATKELEVRMTADQSGRNMGFGQIVLQFNCKEMDKYVHEIKALTGKSSLQYYVYK